MGRPARALASALGLAGVVAATLTAGCGDPLVILGDLPGILRIVAGLPDSVGVATDSLAVRTLLNTPRGLAADSDGVIYIADSRNSRILAVRSNGRLEVILDHRNRIAQPRLDRPEGLALDEQGRLVIADPFGLRLWRVDPATRAAAVIAGTGVLGFSPDSTEALAAMLNRPTGVAVASDGTIYFTERFNHRVRVIRADGTLGTIAGTGVAGFSGDGGMAALAELSSPAGLALGAGTLYVVDNANQRVRAIDLATGVIRTVAGNGVAAYGGDGGPATQAMLNRPEAVAISPDGRSLFIADTDNHRIRIVNLDTQIISTYAGTGDDAYNGDQLEAGATGLSVPAGLTVSPQDLLFLSDTGHHIVRRTPVRFAG